MTWLMTELQPNDCLGLDEAAVGGLQHVQPNDFGCVLQSTSSNRAAADGRLGVTGIGLVWRTLDSVMVGVVIQTETHALN